VRRAMTGIFNHLTKDENRHVLERLTTEIREKFQVDEEITFDSIQSLPYLDAVINEGLRLCNPVPGGLPRVVPEGGDTYCGIFLPEGVSLISACLHTNMFLDSLSRSHIRRQPFRTPLHQSRPFRTRTMAS
jgi:cytochrome P450